jgi:hypothetical protein
MESDLLEALIITVVVLWIFNDGRKATVCPQDY